MARIKYFDKQKQIWEYADNVVIATGGAIVGSTFFSPTPINDANVHLLDGGIVAKTGIYEEFYNKFITPLKTSNPELFVTDTVHAQEIAQHKVTNKFVDNADNIRLPKFGEYNFTVNEQIGVQGNGKGLGITDGVDVRTLSSGVASNTSGYLINTYGDGTNNLGEDLVKGKTLKTHTAQGIVTDPTKSGIEANLQSNLKGYWYIVVSSTSKTDIQTNLDNVTADLNNKADRDLLNTPDNVDVVVEHKINPDGSWYRKYKSGWLEQGGFLMQTSTTNYAITLLKPYANINYIINYTGGTSRTSGNGTNYIKERTTTNFLVIGLDVPNYKANWYACGQGA